MVSSRFSTVKARAPVLMVSSGLDMRVPIPMVPSRFSTIIARGPVLMVPQEFSIIECNIVIVIVHVRVWIKCRAARWVIVVVNARAEHRIVCGIKAACTLPILSRGKVTSGVRDLLAVTNYMIQITHLSLCVPPWICRALPTPCYLQETLCYQPHLLYVNISFCIILHIPINNLWPSSPLIPLTRGWVWRLDFLSELLTPVLWQVPTGLGSTWPQHSSQVRRCCCLCWV